MAPQNPPRDSTHKHTKTNSNSFKMFKLNIRHKDRSVSVGAVDTDALPAMPKSPTRTRKHSSNPEKYVPMWNASPAVNPLRNPPKPREERIPPNMARRINLRVQVLPADSDASRHSRASSTSDVSVRKRSLSVSSEMRSQMSARSSTATSSSSSSSSSTTTIEPSVDRTMSIRHRRLLEEMANNCAREPMDRKDWGYWFKAYTDGRYNMSNPPQTPPRDPLLLWIPTPFPADEIERLKALHRYDVSYASNIETDLRTVLRNAATALGAEFASISLIDYESETFLLNHPIRIGAEPKMKRACSLGAHVMLGGDTMVILDTSKDWRFKGNPSLGEGSKRINFYAASPLVSSDGHNIGVLAITGRSPREVFGKSDLRSLNNFANVVSTHLERLLPENREIFTTNEPDIVELDTILNLATPKYNTEAFKETLLRDSIDMIQNPTAMAPTQTQDIRTRRMDARLETEKKLTAGTKQYDYYRGGLPTFPSLPIPPPAIDTLSPRALPTPPSSASLFAQKMAQRRYRSGFQTPTPPISPTSPPASPPSLGPLNLPLSTFSTPRNLPQARALISDIAKDVDFDYLYIIRLEPTSSKLTYRDLQTPSNFRIVMVHSYRRNSPPAGSANQALNTELHLKALSERSGLTAVNSRENGRMDEEFYQTSVLLPIQRNYVNERGVMGEDGSDGRVCRGHILGAYKRRNTGDSHIAIEKLGAVASALGALMFPTPT
ncbi:hypothetical protein ABW20_dc0109628 [Dactylellina cionopaga]|nr:hypothetical protein ABW20_dc0109628 [Dactylellina cionopaga]